MRCISSWGCVAASSFLLVFALLTSCGDGSRITPVSSAGSTSSTPSGSFLVSAISPASGSTQVALSATIQITFSSAADASTVNAANIRVTAPNAVVGALAYNASTDTATFTPSAALVANSTYTVTISGVTSSTGVVMASTFTAEFATVASSSGAGSGYAPPGTFGVSAVSPAPGATGVPLNSTIQVTFSSPADPSTVAYPHIVLFVGQNDLWPGTVSYDASSNTATYTPTGGLVANTTYTVLVGGITSTAGVAMAGTFTSTFSTAASGPSSDCWVSTLYSASPFACTQYLAPMTKNGTGYDPYVGNIAMDGSGNVAVGLSPVAPSTSFTVQFCPAYNANSSASAPPCFEVGTVSSDASGNVDITTATFKFPRPGSWAGDFQVTSGSTVICQTAAPLGTVLALQTFLVFMLQPETTVNGTGIATGTQDPLSEPEELSSIGGRVGGQLNGAEPNATYIFSESQPRALNGSAEQELCAFTTDSNGNGSCGNNAAGGAIFQIVPQESSHVGWIGGFLVPQ
jgi:Bacterial Ig-like domain